MASTAAKHSEEDFLIKMFAFYTPLPQVIELFRQAFGKPPTEGQISVCNIGRFLGDKRAVFKENDRVRKFKYWRNVYNNSTEEIEIYNQTWRMHQYNHIYKRLKDVAEETGNYSRCLDVLTIAAKDAQGGYSPNKTVNVDNRTVNFNQMSTEDLNRKLRTLMEDNFGVKLDDLPIIEHGDKIIEYDPED